MSDHGLEELVDGDHKFSTTVKHREWRVTDDGKKVEYKGDSHSSVMGDKPLTDEGMNTFSLHVDQAHNQITVGVGTRKFNMASQVGSDPDSWGFNLSSGHLLHDGDTSVSYGR